MPRNWAELLPVVFELLTSAWATSKPISPVLADLTAVLLAANDGAPSARTTNIAKHRIRFIRCPPFRRCALRFRPGGRDPPGSRATSHPLSCYPGVKLRTRGGTIKRMTKSCRLAGGGRFNAEIRVRHGVGPKEDETGPARGGGVRDGPALRLPP